MFFFVTVCLRLEQHHCRNCGKVVCGMCSSQRRVIPGLDNSSPERVCKVCFDLINIEEAQRLSRGSPAQEPIATKPSQELSDSESPSGTPSESSASSPRSRPASEDFLETVVPVSSSEMSSWSGTSFSSLSSSSDSETSSGDVELVAESSGEKAKCEEKSTLQVQEPESGRTEKRASHEKKKKKGKGKK